VITVVIFSLTIVGILTDGLAGGSLTFTWPMALGVLGAGAMVDWLRLRNSVKSAQVVADSMIIYTVFAILFVWAQTR
jgi:hypothetical protein